MVRRRKVPVTLGVCIGIFLLLFSVVAADTIKGPPPIPEMPLASNSSETSIAEENKTIPNKIPSGDGAEVASESDKKVVDSFDSAKRDRDTALSDIIKDAKAEEEKVSVADTNSGPQGIRSRNQVDRLSTSDSTNGGSRFEETLYGTSGKSSSTKSVSDNSTRLTRTNELTVTTKPGLEESRFDEKANKTSLVELGSDAVNRKADASVKSEDVESKGDQVDAKTKFVDSSKGSSTALKLDAIDRDTESTTQKAALEEPQERIKKADLNPTKNSEVSDLEKVEEHTAISLINDTYVNYNRPKSPMEGSEVDSGNQPRVSENATNFISESTVTHVLGDPKGEVEVVENVTHAAIEKVVEQNSKSEVLSERNQQKLVEATTQKGHEEIVMFQATSSPVPRGRTIAFSGLNEYPSLQTKPTMASKVDASVSKKNSTDKVLEQKPYPYAKSSIKEHNSSNHVATEEPSALENTIGRGQSEEKFAVTEASDVLENSIQLKPHHEKSGNESSNISTTAPRPSVPMTTMSLVTLEEAKPTSQSTNDKSNELKTITGPEGKSDSAGNNVPRWGEGREAITGKGNFDVTGNGITEVTLKPESGDKRTYESFQGIVSRTTSAPELTAKPQTEAMPSKADVQTNAESSLLIRSTLNATELSTEYPLIKGNFSKGENATTSPADATTVKTAESALSTTTTEKSLTGNATESSEVPDANGTNEIPTSGNGTLGPEAFLPTTTTVEYEFVGLSEATTSISQITTEEAMDVGGSSGVSTIVPSVQDLFTRSSPNEASTIGTVTTTDNSVVPGETELASIDERSTMSVTDQTTVSTAMASLTTQVRDDFVTQASEGETETSTKVEDGQRASSVGESWTTVSDEEVATTVRMEQALVSGSKDPRFVINVTETVTESMVTSNVSTSTARAATGFVASSLRPRIPGVSTTTVPSVSNMSMEETDVTKVSPFSEEITSLVRIVMDGSSYEVCSKMDKLKSTLAEILTTGLNKSVSDKQIILHQDPCRESSSSTPTPSDMPLTSILVYVVDENGKFDSSMTNSLPTMYKESRDRVKFPFTIHSFLLVQETIPDSGNAIAVVVVSAVAFICLVLLTGLLFIMRKRQTRFNYGERCRPVSLDAYSLDSVSAYNSVRRKGAARSSKRSYGNPTFEDSSAIPSHPLNFAGLSSFCNDVNAINEEFAGIPQVSAKIDELPAGAEVKNRYANVIPLPETRVPLQKVNNDPLSEYINASYVRGPKNAMRYYIACQAPMESTVTDFWRMIWEQQCKVVIMLTDLVENGVEKCTEYIPPSEITDCHRLYGDFQVTLKKRETKEKYAISTLQLKNLENNTFREVYHIWYLWPVNGAQSDGAGLIAILLEARALQRGGPGPIVVHCSPGTGRTGTLIALDLGIRQYEITRTVDVPRVVYTIRRDRAGAVQTREQYAFIYKALNLYATKLAGGVLDST
ncbi:uncharacterized protein LOC143182896 [Calliopsis andreniformis]|uniref:uncharacterized protein LOC143182896 n=1 Tax=Calliopsis andreniformis TaxID=337506 RepID=UPI003FCD6C14